MENTPFVEKYVKRNTMNKKLISLLVAICLVVGLLPVASIATSSEPQTAKITIMKSVAANQVEVTEGGAPVYGISVEFDGYKSDGTSLG